MTGGNTSSPRLARLRKIGTFGVLGLIALALGIGVAVLHSRAEKRRARAEIQKRLDAIRAAGEPVTADDLAKLYPDPPPERDAAPLLAPAILALRLITPASFGRMRKRLRNCRLPAWLSKLSAGGWPTAGARRILLPIWFRSSRPAIQDGRITPHTIFDFKSRAGQRIVHAWKRMSSWMKS